MKSAFASDPHTACRAPSRCTSRFYATALLLTLSLAPAPLRAQIEVTVAPPRANGWWTGDQLVHEALVLPPPGFRIDPASLPRPRSLTYWLDLVTITSREVTVAGRPGYLLRSTWQSFYAPMEPTLLDVPGYALVFRAGDAPSAPEQRAEVPAWQFVTSPLRPILAPTAAEEMAPDAGLAPLPEAALWRRVAGMAVLCLLALGILAHGQGWWPFARSRPDLPLTRALRRARRTQDAQARALMLHRGLDGANGAPLLAADLPDFLRRRPEFSPLAAELAAFFDQSGRAFFGGAPMTAQTFPLLARLAAIERGRR